jgi:hypothetical protein
LEHKEKYALSMIDGEKQWKKDVEKWK